MGASGPFFIFGVARSGTNLVARMLDEHPHATVALDPLLPLFREWRNQAVAQATPSLKHEWSPQSPLQDYYFSEDGAALLDSILNADDTANVPEAVLETLVPAVEARTALESPRLAEAFAKWRGGTWRELLASALRLTREAAERTGKQIQAVGIKEVWTIEFLSALSRAVPEVRFIILHRDPRGVVASQMAMAKKDSTQAAHSISYMRHWRKHVALARMFARDAALAGKVLEVRYEDILKSPMAAAEQLATFVGLNFHPSMLQPGKQRDWESNSSFASVSGDVDTQAADRWREKLPAHVIATVEFYCGIEMQTLGYELTRTNPGRLDADVLRGIGEAHASPGKWRSDSDNEETDLAWECLRWQLASLSFLPRNQNLFKRCFLASAAPL
jgi:hypothetical protein